MNTDDSKISAQYQTLLVVWFALLVSQFLFLGVIYFVKPTLVHFDPAKSLLGSNPTLVVALGVVSLFCLVLSFVWEKKLLDRSVAQQSVALVQVALINACALCEAISLLGVLLAFAAAYSYFFLFSGLGILGTILHFPSRESLLAAGLKL
jgi:hypothetical protein